MCWSPIGRAEREGSSIVLDVRVNRQTPREEQQWYGVGPPETHRQKRHQRARRGRCWERVSRGGDPVWQATWILLPPVANSEPHTHEPANKAHVLRPPFKLEKDG